MNADEIVSRRTDMTRYLFHWTDKSHLCDIVQSGFLVATFASRDVPNGVFNTIRGNKRAVCFSEMPIGNYLQSTVINPSRYKRWGIAIPKKILYAYGARPVLYSDDNFYDRLKTEGDKYRFLFSRYSSTQTPNWRHEREWRILPNPGFNKKIGLKSDEFKHLVDEEEKKLNGKFLIPIHLPQPNKGELREKLTDEPKYVIFVEKDKNIEEIKFPLKPALVEVYAKRYASINQYRDKYLASLEQASVISFDSVKNERDRRGFWRVEDFIHPLETSQSKFPILWDKATVQTRRQVLRTIDAPEKGYEYFQWQDLLQCDQICTSIHKQIEESEQAIGLLKNDVMEWVRNFLDID
jgi:hypothetical protein